MIHSIISWVWSAFKTLSALAVICAFSIVLILAPDLITPEEKPIETKELPPRLVDNYMALIAISTSLNPDKSTAATGLSQAERTERLLAASVKISLPTHTGSGVLIDNQPKETVDTENPVS